MGDIKKKIDSIRYTGDIEQHFGSTKLVHALKDGSDRSRDAIRLAMWVSQQAVSIGREMVDRALAYAQLDNVLNENKEMLRRVHHAVMSMGDGTNHQCHTVGIHWTYRARKHPPTDTYPVLWAWEIEPISSSTEMVDSINFWITLEGPTTTKYLAYPLGSEFKESVVDTASQETKDGGDEEKKVKKVPFTIRVDYCNTSSLTIDPLQQVTDGHASLSSSSSSSSSPSTQPAGHAAPDYGRAVTTLFVEPKWLTDHIAKYPGGSASPRNPPLTPVVSIDLTLSP